MDSLRTVFSFADKRRCTATACSSCVDTHSRTLLFCLGRGNGRSVVAYLFRHGSALTFPTTMTDLPISSVIRTRQVLGSLVSGAPGRRSTPSIPPMAFYCAPGHTCALCILPHGALFTRLANIARPSLCICTYLCSKQLLLTPSSRDLSYCVNRLSGGRILRRLPTCRRDMSNLSSICGFVLITSLRGVFTRPRDCIQLIPNFFFHGPSFFHRFILSTRFADVSKRVCPGMILRCGKR